jgi:ketosteroid isomerase-like protein
MKALSVSMLSLFTILLYCVSSLPVASQSVPSTADEEARVLSLEGAWNHAEQQKDTQALNLLLADTLSYVDYDGTLMDKPQFLVSARDRSLHPVLITDESIRAHIYEQSAVVTGIYRETGTNKKQPYQRRGRFTDTWVKLGDTWQCVASQSTLIP